MKFKILLKFMTAICRGEGGAPFITGSKKTNGFLKQCKINKLFVFLKYSSKPPKIYIPSYFISNFCFSSNSSFSNESSLI